MPTMTKPKKKTEDRHGSGFMTRLPEVYRTQLRKLRARTRRPMTAEIQIALEEHLAKEGLWPPEAEEEAEE
jgi:hypothetical protein